MLDVLRQRIHKFGGLIHYSIESAFLTGGALLILLALLIFCLGFLAMKTE